MNPNTPEESSRESRILSLAALADAMFAHPDFRAYPRWKQERLFLRWAYQALTSTNTTNQQLTDQESITRLR